MIDDAPPYKFESLAEIRRRVEAILTADAVPDGDAIVGLAGDIPSYYGKMTAREVSIAWLNMAAWAKIHRPADEAFYTSNAIAWASRG